MMSSTATKPRPKRTSNPGVRLLRARHKLRLTRKDVAGRLGVSNKEIKLIDQWQVEQLDQREVKRLLRQYALLVHLNPAEYEGFATQLDTKPYKKKSLIVLSQTSIVLIAAVITLAIIGFVSWRTFSATNAPQLEVFEPAQGALITTPSLKVTGQASQQAQVFVNGIVAPIDPNGNYTSEVVLQEGINVIEITAVNSFGREVQVIRTVDFSPLD